MTLLTLLSRWTSRLHDEDRGATAVEYGLMVALIAVVIIGAVAALGTNLDSIFDRTATCIGTPAECS